MEVSIYTSRRLQISLESMARMFVSSDVGKGSTSARSVKQDVLETAKGRRINIVVSSCVMNDLS